MHSDPISLKTYALVGTPNSGKTTLYNWLTGSKFRTVNYPGATVEYSIGSLAPHVSEKLGESFQLMDTPGAYSLQPKSPDEEVTLKSLYDHPHIGKVSGVIVVIDGTQMDRHLLMAEQLRGTGFPLLMVITMADLLRRQKVELNLSRLQAHFNCEVLLFDGVLGSGLNELAAAITRLPPVNEVQRPTSWSHEVQKQKLIELEQLVEQVLVGNNQDSHQRIQNLGSRSEKLDRLFLHPFFGLLSFFLVMSALFGSIFWLATPFMDLIDSGFGWAIEHVLSIGGEESLLADFLGNGVLAAFASVLVFVPQVFILFIGIGLLEGSGYLARAATIIDKPLSLLGLGGRSFVPLLSGYACAVPAMIATRNISSPRERWIANFIIPLMSCSARLPVYSLLIAFLFVDQSPWLTGFIFALIYLLSSFVGALAAGILNKILPSRSDSFFMMELPLYRWPRWQVLWNQSLSRTKSYVVKAGPIIFVLAVLIWVGTSFPQNKHLEPSQQIAASYLGQAGHVLEPIFEPMGLDWRVGVGLISAFAAREVFVATTALVFGVTADNEDGMQAGLLSVMQEAVRADGEKVFTVGSVLGLIAFFMIAMQCMSTFAVSVRESGSWKFALTQLIVLNVVAYLLAVGLNIIF